MHGSLGLAVDGDAGAVHLGEAVDVVQVHAQFIGDALAHLVAPALGADHALSQAYLIPDPPLRNLLGQQQGVGGGGAEHRGFHVHHHPQLFVRISRPHGNRHGPQAFRAQLEADACGPQAVSGGDLDAVHVGDSGHLVAALEHEGPVVHVLLGVGTDHRSAGGAGRGVDAHDLLLGFGHQAQGIGLPQVALPGKGELLEVLLGLNLVNVDPFQLLLVKTFL